MFGDLDKMTKKIKILQYKADLIVLAGFLSR